MRVAVCTERWQGQWQAVARWEGNRGDVYMRGCQIIYIQNTTFHRSRNRSSRLRNTYYFSNIRRTYSNVRLGGSDPTAESRIPSPHCKPVCAPGPLFFRPSDDMYTLNSIMIYAKQGENRKGLHSIRTFIQNITCAFQKQNAITH